MTKLTVREMRTVRGGALGCRGESTCVGCIFCMIEYGAGDDWELCLEYAPACE